MAKPLTNKEAIEALTVQVDKLSKLLVPKKIHDIANHEDYVPSDSAYDEMIDVLHVVCDQFSEHLAPRELAQALDTTKFLYQLREHLIEE